MTFEDFKRERVRQPEYGTAPAELIAQYEAVIKEMEKAYSEGVALSSDIMLALDQKAAALSNEISKYPPKT